jgi:hypothetical protein
VKGSRHGLFGRRFDQRGRIKGRKKIKERKRGNKRKKARNRRNKSEPLYEMLHL